LAGRQPNKPELVFLDARLPALYAGLAIKVEELTALWKRPAVVNAGFAANTLVPSS